VTRANRGERVLDFFLDREGRPVDTFTLERLFGRRSWRTAISDGRKLARVLRRDIKNELHPVYRRGKFRRVDSTYTLVKVAKRKAA
jgi:hypothetical protein